MSFSKDFLWGAASSSAQIEGAFDEGGKALSIWDMAGDRIKNKETCRIACDHYHRYKEDVALMKELGLRSYRFSVSMSRVMPEKGKINREGLAFYSSLVDELVSAGIEPLCTLYHWDLPQWAEDEGGWKNENIADWYLEYAAAVVDALSDRVACWMTFNEPQVFIMMGYAAGAMAPFKNDVQAFREHHMRNFLLAHGKCVRMIRERAKKAPKIGIAMAAYAYIPANETEECLRDARQKSFESQVGEGTNSLYMDPIGLGKASPMMTGILSEEDLAVISSPLDFVGLNVYQPANPLIDPEAYAAENHPKTSMGWYVDGRCLYWTIRQFWERYHLPVMVTENGMAADDTVSEDGACHDPERAHFLDEFISNMKRSTNEDIPVIGYQHWSVMDNFEWCEGYGPRFGLIHVDYETQKRTIKDSARHYAEIIRTNGENVPAMWK